VARHIFALGVPVVIVLNKVDRLKPAHIASQMKQAAELGDFHALHPVSAKTGEGIDDLRSDLVQLLPDGPLYFPPETETDLPLEARIAELVREQALRVTREEIPHALTAEVVEVDEKRVHVRLYTETESQKQILIGKGGSIVREIGRSARPAIEQLLGHNVYLQLQVKAAPKWRRNRTMLERLGL
jgi:GTP-binding protein Era